MPKATGAAKAPAEAKADPTGQDMVGLSKRDKAWQDKARAEKRHPEDLAKAAITHADETAGDEPKEDD